MLVATFTKLRGLNAIGNVKLFVPIQPNMTQRRQLNWEPNPAEHRGACGRAGGAHAALAPRAGQGEPAPAGTAGAPGEPEPCQQHLQDAKRKRSALSCANGTRLCASSVQDRCDCSQQRAGDSKSPLGRQHQAPA